MFYLFITLASGIMLIAHLNPISLADDFLSKYLLVEGCSQ